MSDDEFADLTPRSRARAERRKKRELELKALEEEEERARVKREKARKLRAKRREADEKGIPIEQLLEEEGLMDLLDDAEPTKANALGSSARVPQATKKSVLDAISPRPLTSRASLSNVDDEERAALEAAREERRRKREEEQKKVASEEQEKQRQLDEERERAREARRKARLEAVAQAAAESSEAKPGAGGGGDDDGSGGALFKKYQAAKHELADQEERMVQLKKRLADREARITELEADLMDRDAKIKEKDRMLQVTMKKLKTVEDELQSVKVASVTREDDDDSHARALAEQRARDEAERAAEKAAAEREAAAVAAARAEQAQEIERLQRQLEERKASEAERLAESARLESAKRAEDLERMAEERRLAEEQAFLGTTKVQVKDEVSRAQAAGESGAGAQEAAALTAHRKKGGKKRASKAVATSDANDDSRPESPAAQADGEGDTAPAHAHHAKKAAAGKKRASSKHEDAAPVAAKGHGKPEKKPSKRAAVKGAGKKGKAGSRASKRLSAAAATPAPVEEHADEPEGDHDTTSSVNDQAEADDAESSVESEKSETADSHHDANEASAADDESNADFADAAEEEEKALAVGDTPLGNGFGESDKALYVDWLNVCLAEDEHVSMELPIDVDSNELYKLTSAGIMPCKLLNTLVPGAGPSDGELNYIVMDDDDKKENLELCFECAEDAGAKLDAIHVDDVIAEKPAAVLSLLWQLIRLPLVKELGQQKKQLGLIGKKTGDGLKMDADEVILNWANHWLSKGGAEAANLGLAWSDLENYSVLLMQLGGTKTADLRKKMRKQKSELGRAKLIIKTAESLGAASLVSPAGILSGNHRQNWTFLLSLFVMAENSKK